MSKIETMEKLIHILNLNTELYDQGIPEISDREWDDMYFDLVKLEEETNTILPNSPTSKISYTVMNALNKVEHNHPMLSLEKTKELDTIKSFIGNKPYIAMCKMDGLTCTLHYVNGKLVSAETRGNGEEGEDVLHNAQVIKSIPKVINYKEDLIIDGEIICDYHNFKHFEKDYKNPRNFAAGSIRLLDSKECSRRRLTFVAWEVIEGLNEFDLLSEKLNIIEKYGFTIVPFMNNKVLFPEINEELVEWLKTAAKLRDFPIDGIVFKFDNVAYGKSLGQTAHHFKNAMAYKFYDETYETNLIDIEWTMGRTGVLTPVAIFNPIDIDGSEVSRASLHNISIMLELLGIPYKNQKLEIFKANMIIPQVYRADKAYEFDDYEYFDIPMKCPICGELTHRECELDTWTLKCANTACEGKLVNQLDHFCGKKGLDIKGLSIATLEKLIDWGWVSEPADLFELHTHANEWANKPGFGARSVEKILSAIEAGKNSTLDSFISAIGIPLIGQNVAKDLINYISSYEDLRNKAKSRFDFTTIPGFAGSKCAAIWNFDFTKADKAYTYLKCEMPQEEEKLDNNLANKVIVITGKLSLFKNREELAQQIRAHGGKVSSSVSKATSYLINNDNTSQTAKNLTAIKLGVPILTEETFVRQFLTN
jgi:DNA ligase (NAD+)